MTAQILSESLSRLHCAIGLKDDVFYIEDLHSRNGTWVNGIRVKQAVLTSGDKIKIGAVEFEFRTNNPKSQPKAEAEDEPGAPIKEKFDIDHTELMHLEPGSETLENYRRVQKDLATLFKIGTAINSITDLDSLFGLLMDAIQEVTSAHRAYLILANESGDALGPVVALGGKDQARGGEPAFSTTIAEECFRSGYSFVTPDAMADDRVSAGQSIIMQRIRAAMCVPVQTQDRILGVIYADTVSSAKPFGRHELQILTAIGKQAGIAIDRASLIERVQTQLYESVRTLVATIEAKDNYTCGHSERVTAYAMQIAEELGFVGEGLSNIQLAGLLHDVGKVGTPEHILNKPGRLTDEEFAIIKEHPVVGANIIGNIKDTKPVVDVVRHHHERFDGRGYPDGLAGEAIPLDARILAVADSFDAMTSKRPYREVFDKSRVIEEYQKYAGSQFDPHIAKVFLALYQTGRIYVPELIYFGQTSDSSHGPSNAAFSIRRTSTEAAPKQVPSTIVSAPPQKS